jgi:hypothetical protein
MTQADWLRILIIILALVAPVLIIILNHHKRHQLNWGDVLTRIGLGGVFLAVAYSTLESYLQGVGLVPRLYVLTGALIWVDVGLIASILHDRKCFREEREAALKAHPELKKEKGNPLP